MISYPYGNNVFQVLNTFQKFMQYIFRHQYSLNELKLRFRERLSQHLYQKYLKLVENGSIFFIRDLNSD